METPDPQTLDPDLSQTPDAVSDRPMHRLRLTTYIWFVLLCLGALWSRLPEAPRTGASLSRSASDAAGASPSKPQGGGARLDSVSAQSFSELVQAEQLTRSALASERLSRFFMQVAREAGKPAGAPKAKRPDDPKRSSQQLYTQAIRQTRDLARQTGSVNLTRRVIVLEHAAGRPFNAPYVQKDLAARLKNRGVSAADTATEVAFWQRLYGSAAPTSLARDAGTLLAQTDTQLGKMELGLLEDQVRADAYAAAGEPTQASAVQSRVSATALRSFTVVFGTNGLLFLGGVVGTVLLLVLMVLAVARQLNTVLRFDSPRFGPELFGILIDCFVFYFALLFLSRPLLGLLARQLVPSGTVSASPAAALGFTAAGYLLVHGVAAIYTTLTLRQSGYALSAIGLNGRRILQNIGWGVIGYCAVIPFVALLGILAHTLFKDNPNVTPNPALPLLTSVEGVGPRLLIFLLVAVSAPVFEEFFFRGVLYTGLRSRWGVAASVVISAALFAIGHPIQDWLPIFGLGMAFALLREWRQSLVPSMLAHFLQNGLTFLTLSALFSK